MLKVTHNAEPTRTTDTVSWDYVTKNPGLYESVGSPDGHDYYVISSPENKVGDINLMYYPKTGYNRLLGGMDLVPCTNAIQKNRRFTKSTKTLTLNISNQ